MGAQVQFGGGAVSPRFDTFGYHSARWFNPLNGQGSAMDRSPDTVFLPGEPIPAFTVDALMRFQGIARRIVTREPKDALREGLDFDGMEAGARRATLGELDRLGALAKFKEARTWEKAYGGGAIIVMVEDGKHPSEPIDPTAIRRVASLLVVDRHELAAEDWDIDPRSANYGQPKTWTLHGGDVSGASEVSGTTFHHSRVIVFGGLQLPRREVVLNSGWGGSELDLVWNELRTYGSTHAFAAEAVSLFTQGVFKTDVAKAVRSDNATEMVNRLKALRQGMGILGDLILDKNEDYQIQTRPMAGIADALEKFVAALVAATDMPRSILLGESPGGLNNGENAGEVRSWYDHVAAGRPDIYTPRMMHLLLLIWHSKQGPTGGAVPNGWRIEWPDLWQLTEIERAEVRVKNAQARSVDVNAGIVSEDEAKQDPDLITHYPTIDPSAPAPGLPASGGGGFANAEGEDDDASLDETAAIVPAANSLIPPGERLLTARKLGDMYGWTPGRVRNLASAGHINMFRAGNGRAGYLESEFLRAIGAKQDAAVKGGRGDGPFAVTAAE